MALPITIPNTFATESNNIPLSDLDANFTAVADGVNGIGDGSESLANVSITGGSVANVSISDVTATNVTANVVSISDVTITGGDITGITDLAVADGGTGASTAADARTNLSAAKSGANSDITSLSGLTTPLSVAQGGTGSANLTANSVLIGNGTSAVSGVAPGTSGNILTSNGTAWTSAALPSLGVGQTWTNVTGSRSIGSSYTNSTSSPIQVAIRTNQPAGGSYLTGTVDGVSGIPMGSGYSAGGGYTGFGTLIVPAGKSYQVDINNISGGASLAAWYELR